MSVVGVTSGVTVSKACFSHRDAHVLLDPTRLTVRLWWLTFQDWCRSFVHSISGFFRFRWEAGCEPKLSVQWYVNAVSLSIILKELCAGCLIGSTLNLPQQQQGVGTVRLARASRQRDLKWTVVGNAGESEANPSNGPDEVECLIQMQAVTLLS